MVFFTVPTEPKGQKRRGKDGACKNRLNSIEKCQNEAWMLAVNRGCGKNVMQWPNDKRIRICMHHFHPSVHTCDDNGKHTLKIGANPTMHVSRFSMENEACKEDQNACRIAGSPKDHDHI